MATLLTIIGEEARDVHSTFTWTTAGGSGHLYNTRSLARTSYLQLQTESSTYYVMVSQCVTETTGHFLLLVCNQSVHSSELTNPTFTVLCMYLCSHHHHYWVNFKGDFISGTMHKHIKTISSVHVAVAESH